MAFLIETSVTHSVIATDRSSSSVVYYAVSQLRIPLACLNAYHLYRANLERGLKARCITGGKKSEEGARERASERGSGPKAGMDGTISIRISGVAPILLPLPLPPPKL